MAINWPLLDANRERLLTHQTRQRGTDRTGQIWLNLGSGDVHLPGFINLDLYSAGASVVGDMCRLPCADGSVDGIVSHHALEHISQRDISPTLAEWWRVLKENGYLEIGMPDIGLCCEMFLEMDGAQRWQWGIYTIYGWQIGNGQTHRAGLTQKHLLELLQRERFHVIDSYPYNGNGTPSVFVQARK